MKNLRELAVLGAVLATFSFGCSDSGTDPSVEEDHHDSEEAPGEVSQGSEELISAVSCKERTDTSYIKGKASTIKVITIGGKPVSKATGHAFLKMQKAAHAAGVSLAINSGFRTMAEQQHLYGCYVNGNCNNGNLAAKPGYSNHQSGPALDLTTSSWLAKNAGKYGFIRTVPSEAWHYEYTGGSDPGGPCSNSNSAPPDTNTPAPTTSLSWLAPKNDATVGRQNVVLQVKVTNDKVATIKFFQGTLNFASATREENFATEYSFKYTGDKTLTAVGYDANDNEVDGSTRNVDVSVSE